MSLMYAVEGDFLVMVMPLSSKPELLYLASCYWEKPLQTTGWALVIRGATGRLQACRKKAGT